MTMEKRNEIRAGVTPCRFCQKTAVIVDEKGAPRCEDHLNAQGDSVKSASVNDLPQKHLR